MAGQAHAFVDSQAASSRSRGLFLAGAGGHSRRLRSVGSAGYDRRRLPESRPFPPTAGALLARLRDAHEAIAKAWLLRLLERTPLEDMRRMPTDRIASGLPRLVAQIVERSGEPAADSGDETRLASQLVALVGRDPSSPAGSARDVASLHAAMFAVLRREGRETDDEAFAEAGERLSSTIAGIQLAAVEELVGERFRELERLANTDPLTGLYNLRHLERQLEQVSAVHERYGHPFSLLLLDVDGLKRVNDAHGHAAGDRLLKQVAAALRRSLRSVDVAVRLGGDEFCVLAVDQTGESAEVLARRVAAEVASLEAPGGIRPSVSIGVVSCPHHGREPEGLLKLADEAMYRAKAAAVAVVVDGEQPSSVATGAARAR